jgi:4-amino-4-deoxy-L-arabinose transferase-like glycosyltransferase
MISAWPYKKRVVILIIVSGILRTIIAWWLELANDESYYLLYSQFLQWNYFDHPPMVALSIRLFTANLYLEYYPFFLRLGSITGCALSTWFMYKCVTTLSTERAGWLAACLYNASFYCSITAGLLALPDAPQMIFWTFGLWMIAKIAANENKWQNWILLGVSTGLCIMSKVHGVFIWAGIGVYILIFRRTWLKYSKLYVSLLLTMVIACPILIWNLQNDFVTYIFHSRRMVIYGYLFNWNNLLKEFISELVINNPINVVLMIIGLFRIKRNYKNVRALSIYKCIGLSLGLAVLLLSLFRDTRPIWSGPAYVTLLPLAAIYLAGIKNLSLIRKIIYSGWSLLICGLAFCAFIIDCYPGNFGSKTKSDLGKGDISLDMYGWKAAGKQFTKLYKNEIRKGVMPKESPMVCNSWWGAHQEYYFCKPSGIYMIGLGSMMELHQYMLTNKERRNNVDFNNAYCVVASDENYNVYDHYSKYYSQIDSVGIIEIFRNKKPAHNFYIYRLKGWKNNLPFYGR